MKQDLYTIQEVSAILGVSAKTLRRWEETGVIKPIRTAGNQRRYRLEDVKKLERRRRLKDIKKEVKEEITSTLPIAPQPVFIQTEPEPQPEFIPVVKAAPLEAPVRRDYINDYGKRFFKPVAGAIFALLFLLGGATLWQQLGYPGLHQGANSPQQSNEEAVLGANDAASTFQLNVNVPGMFGKQVTFLDKVDIQKGLTVKGLSQLNGGIKTNNANINAGTGKLTASNVLYSIVAGSNITISGDKQNPVISAGTTGVSSLQGTTGAIALAQGSGISLNGLTINNTGVLSVQGTTGDVTFNAGNGVSISGTTITNSDTGSAQNIFKNFDISGTDISASNNNDTINFAAGSGISLTGDAGSKTITITGSGGGLSGLTTNGVLYATSGTTAGTVVGTTGTVLQGITNGAPVFSAVDLTADVSNILPVGNGGTGTGTTATNGEILIGNGSGYTLATLTQGSGIGIANGVGSISIANTGVTSATSGSGIGVSQSTGAITLTNNGVLSLTGTANQVDVSGSTGNITVSLPQNIDTSSTATFASAILTNNTNPLTLGTGNTATITLGGLTGNRTYTLPDLSGTICLSVGNCSGSGGSLTGSGAQDYIPVFTSSSGIGDSDIYDNGKIGIGTTSPEGLFSVSGGVAGQALVSLNNTAADQNILVGSASGTTRFAFDSSGNLTINGGAYQINGTNVLTTNSLGTGILSSSLTSVGSLSGGSLASGFGNIAIGNSTISGGDIASSGTTGFTASGNGAGLNFSTGTGNHIISASSGTLELGTTTLTGAITGNSQDIIGLGTINGLAITANTGTITSGTWNGTAIGALYGGTGINTSGATGVPYISSGIWSVDANSLATTHGGTGQTGYSVGDLLYANTTTTLSKLGIGGNGQVLTVSGGVPMWSNTGGTLNFWQENAGAVEPFNITDDLLLGSTATTSAKFAFENVAGGTPTASISANNGNNATYLSGNGILGTTNGQTLTIGSASTGNIVINGIGTGVVHANNGALSAGLVANNELVNSSITINGSTGLSVTGSPVSLGGTITLTNTGVSLLSGTANQIIVSNPTGSVNLSLPQDIDTGATPEFNGLTLSGLGSGVVQSASGTLSSGNLDLGTSPYIAGTLGVTNGGTGLNTFNKGDLLYASGANTLAALPIGGTSSCLVSDGTVPTWSSCSGVGTNYWQIVSGAISPVSETNDLLLGSTATTSAKFAFENVAGGTPTASISANLGNNATYLSGAGILGVTNAQTLQLGSGSTGNVALSPGGANALTALASGSVGVGTSSPASLFSVGSSSPFQVNSSGSIAAATGITSSGTIDFTGLGSGVVQSASGTLSAGNLNLATGPVTGILPLANGGTNADLSSSVSNGGIVYSTSSSLAILGANAHSGLALVSGGAGTPSWFAPTQGSLIFAGANGALSQNNGQLFFDNANNLLGIGTSSPTAPLQVNGAYGGNAAAIINQLNSGNIFTASASGTTEFNVTNNGSIQFNGGSGFSQTLTSNATAGKTYNFPTFTGSSTDICLSTGNCAGSGGGVTGSGTATQLAFFTGVNAISSDSTLYFDNTKKLLGIGTGTPTAPLQVNGAYGGNAAEIVNQLNSGNIFTASASGTTAFTIQNNGNLAATGTITGLTGITSSGAIDFSGLGTGIVQSATGTLSSSAINLGTIGSSYITGTLGVGNGGTGVASFGGTNTLLYTTSANTLSDIATVNNAALITNGSGAPGWISATANQVLRADGSGNVGFGSLDLSQSGTVGSSILNVANGGTGLANVTSGDLLYGNGTGALTVLPISGTGGECLTSNGSTPGWQTCPGSGIQNYWQLNSGALSPFSTTADLLLGGTATTSAKFAFEGVDTTSPIASISAQNGSGTTGLVLNGNGSIQALNNNTLTIGGNTTGNIALADNQIQLTGSAPVISSTGTLTINAFTLGGGITGNNQSITGVNTLSFGANNLSLSGTAITTTGSNNNLTLTPNGSGTILLTSTYQSGVEIGGSVVTPQAPLFINGGIGNNGALIVNNTNNGDLFDASASGTTKFQINNNGNIAATGAISGLTGLSSSGTITLSNGTFTGNNAVIYGTATSGQLAGVTATSTGGQCLLSGSGAAAPGWGSCPGSSSVNYFQMPNSGAIAPFSTTADLLLGGTATTSADFAFIGNDSTNPTASISAVTNGGNKNGISLSSTNATIQSLNNNTLTIGGNTTGNIALADNQIQLTGSAPVISSTGTLTINAFTLGGAIAGNGQGITSIGNITANGSGNTITGFGTIGTTGTTTFDGTVLTLTGGAASDITTTGNNNLTLTAAGSGNTILSSDFNSGVLIGSSSNTIAPLSISGGIGNNGALIVNKLNLGDIFDASAAGTTKFAIQNDGTIVSGKYTGSNSLLYTNGGTFTQLGIGGAGTCLMGGASLTWSACAGGTNLFQENLGALSPANITDDLLLGGTSTASAKFAFINNTGSGTPTASISAGTGSTYLTGVGVLGTTNAQTLQLGSVSTGNVVLSPGGSGEVQFFNANNFFTSAGALTLAGTGNALNLSGAGANINFSGTGTGEIVTANNQNLALLPGGTGDVGINVSSGLLGTLDIRGNSGTTPVATISGNTASPSLLVDNSGSGDFFTASSSGATKFVIANNGSLKVNGGQTSDIDTLGGTSLTIGGSTATSLTLGRSSGVTINLPGLATDQGILFTSNTGLLKQTAAPGSGGLCLLSATSGGTPTWGSCPGGGTQNYWQSVSGTLSPLSETQDLLLGATATTSADFAFTGVDSTNPTASISAVTNGGNKNGISLSASTPTIQSLNDSTLTLGGNTTGNILLSPLNGGAGSTLTSNALSNIFSGSGAGLTFNGGGTNTLSSTGTLQINAFTLGGGITGNNQSITGVNTLSFGSNNLSLSGTAITTTGSNNNITLTPNGSGQVITGDSKSGLVIGTTASTPISLLVNNGIGNNGELVVNQPNNGDLIDASASGTTKFQLNNNGDILLSGTTRLTNAGVGTFANNTVVGTDTFAANAINDSGALAINSNGASTLTLQSTGTGNIQFFNNNNTLTSAGALTLASNLTVNGTTVNVGNGSAATIQTPSGNANLALVANGSGTVLLTSTYQSGVEIGGSVGTPKAPLFINGGIGNNGALIVNNTNNGDLIDASASGATEFQVGNSGTVTAAGLITANAGLTLPSGQNLTLAGINGDNQVLYGTATSGQVAGVAANGTGGLCLLSGSGAAAPGWGSCPGSSSVNYWQMPNSGAISPFSTTADLLLGGTATTSAKFAFEGVDTTSPIASISAQNGSGTTGLVLNGNGSIQALNNNTLTIGGNTTGNIALADNQIQLTGSAPVISSTGTLTINAFTLGGGITGNNQSITGVNTLSFGSNNLSLSGTAITTTGSNNNLTLTPNGSGTILLTSTYQSGVEIGGSVGTPKAPLFINGGIGNNGALIVNNTNNGDLIDASASGTTKFQLNNNGDILLSGTTRLTNAGVGTFANNTVVGTDTFAANAINDSGALAINSNGASTLTLQSTGTGNIQFFNNNNTLTSAGALTLASNLTVNGTTVNLGNGSSATVQAASGNSNLTLAASGNGTVLLKSSAISGVEIGGSVVTPQAPLFINGGIGNNGALIVNNTNSGDLFDASASGTTKFQINNNGNIAATGAISGLTGLSSSGTITLSNGTFTGNNAVIYGTATSGQLAGVTATSTGGQCLLSGSGAAAPGWGSCPGSSSVNYFQMPNSGAIAPFSTTADLLLGGTATTSADFAFIGNDSTNPTASISAVTNGGNKNGISLSSTNATIQSLNNNTLTIGGNTTGNIALADNQIQLTGSAPVISSTGTLTINAFTLGGAIAGNGQGITSIGNITANGSGNTITGFGTIGTTGTTTFDGNTLLLAGNNTDITTNTTNSNLTLAANGTGTILLTSTYQSGVEIGGSVGTPKAPLVINGGIGNNGALIVNNTNNGDLFDASAAGITKFQVSNGGAITAATTSTINGINISAGTISNATYQGNTIGSQYGGTGADLHTAVQGDIPYFSSTGVMNALATGTSGQCLQTQGGSQNPIWGNCALGTNYWQMPNSGAIAPFSTTADLLLGGTATTSAKFAFEGVDTTSPIASISAQNGSGTTGLVLNGNGSIQALNNNTLTIGGNTTGNIALADNQIQLTGSAPVISSTGTLTINAFTLGGAIAGANQTINNIGNITANGSGNTITGFGTIGTTGTTTFDGNTLLLAGNNTDITTNTANSNLTLAANGSGTLLLRSTYQSGVEIGGSVVTPQAPLFINGGIGNNGALIVNNTNNGDLIDASQAGTLKFSVSNAGNIAGAALNLSGLSASSFLVTDGSKNLSTSTALPSSALAAALSDETGTGVVVFGTSPAITTSLTTGSGTFALVNGTATTVNFAGAATAVNIGASGGSVTLGNGGASTLTTSSNGNLTVTAAGSGQLLLSSTYQQGIAIGSANSTPAPLVINGGIGNNGALIVNNKNNGDLFDASASGTTKFQINNNGDILLSGTTRISNAGVGTFITGTTIGSQTFTTNNIADSGSLTIKSGGSGTLTLDTAGAQQINIGNANSNAIALGNGTQNTTLTLTGTGLTTLGGNLTVNGTTVNLGNGSSATVQAASGNSNLTLAASGNGTVLLKSSAISGVEIGGSVVTPQAPLFINGGIGNNGALIVNNTNNGDLFDASASGTTKFQINNNGNIAATGAISGLTGLSSSGTITLSNGTFTGNNAVIYGTATSGQLAGVTATSTGGQCLLSGSGAAAPGWGSCPGSSSVNYFQMPNSGAIAPFSTTADLLLGGTATTSADFAFTGVDSTNPTASISAVTNGGNKNGISLSASTPTIQSLNDSTLTLGGNTTGNILLSPLNGGAGSTLTSNALSNIFSGSGAGLTFNGGGTNTLSSTGTLQINAFTLGGGITGNNQSITGVNTLSFGSNNLSLSGTAITTTGSNNNITLTPNGSGQVITGDSKSGLVIGTTASTPISLLVNNGIGNNGELVVNQPNNGDLIDASASGTTKFQLNNNGDILLSGTTRLTNAGVGTFANNTVVGTDTFAANAINDSGALAINSNGASTLTLQSTGTGNIQFFNNNNTLTSAGALTLASNLTVNGTTVNVGNGSAATIQTPSGNANLALVANGSGTVLLTSTYQSGVEIGGSVGTPKAPLFINGGIGNNGALIVNNTNNGDLIDASQAGTLKFSVSNAGNIAGAALNLSGLSASSFLVTDGSKNLSTSTALPSSALAAALSDETGTGVVVFGTSPAITTSLTTGSGTFALVNGTATTVNFAGAATAVNIGASGGSVTLGNGGASTLTTSSNGNLTVTAAGSGQLLLSSTYQQGIAIGSANSTPAPLVINGGIGNNGALIVNNKNNGDLFDASASGTTKFQINNNGNIAATGAISGLTGLSSSGTITLSNGTFTGNNAVIYGTATSGQLAGVTATSTGGQCLLSGSGAAAPGWGSCPAGASSNYWQLSSGTIDPFSQTADILMGGTNPTATTSAGLHIYGSLASGTTPVASISAKTSFASLVVNNSGAGDIFTASAAGATRFTIKNSGVVVIGNNTNGIIFDPTELSNPTGQIYFGTARPTRQIVLSPEYDGVVLSASGSATDNGFMTSDASPSAQDNQSFRTYYQWTSTQTSLNNYNVVVRVTLPKDFSSWPTSNAMTVDMNTQLTTSADNALTVYIYNHNFSDSTPVLYDQNETSASQKTWKTIGYTGAQLSNWSTGGQTATIYLNMTAKNSNYIQVGDIVLNYLSAF